MEQEVPDEVQAAMAVKLVEDVRKLIRDEIKLALEDYQFVGTVSLWAVTPRLMAVLQTDTLFQMAVKNVVAQQMAKP